MTRLPRTRVRQWLRYSAVSLVATVTSLTVLGCLVGTTAMPAAVANLIATAAGTVPSFELNRRWVWRRTGRRSVRAELAPFWVLSFTGLALSTASVSAAAAWADAGGVHGFARTAVIEVANVVAWGALWVAQFVILDRLLFRTPAPEIVPDTAPDLPPGAGSVATTTITREAA